MCHKGLPIFDQQSNVRISLYMNVHGHLRNRFVIISRLIPKYTAKQISNQWRNYLDPRLCHDPLEDYEKNFIVEQAQSYQDIICWKNIIRNLENEFGKLRSENKVKNFWNSRQKSRSKKARTETKEVDSSGSYTRIPVSSLLNKEE